MTTDATLDTPTTAGPRRRRRALLAAAAVVTVVAVAAAGQLWSMASDRSWAGDRCKAAAMDADAARAAADPSKPAGSIGGSLDVRLEWTPLPTWFCDIGWEDGTSETVTLGRRINFP